MRRCQVRRGSLYLAPVMAAVVMATLALAPVAASADVPVASTVLPTTGYGGMVVDGAHSHVFVSSPTSSAVVVLDFNGNIVKTITGEPGATRMVLHGSTLYVLLTTAGAIGRIDTTTLLSTGVVASGLVGPIDLAFAGGLLWTTTGGCGQFGTQWASVNPTTGHVTTFQAPTIFLAYCTAFAADPADPNVLLAWDLGLEPANITKINVSGGSPVVVLDQREENLGNLQDISISPDGTKFFPASGAPYEIDEYNMSNLSPDGVVYPTGPYPIASANTTGLVAAGLEATESAAVQLFQTTFPYSKLNSYDFTGQLYSRGLAFSPDGSKLFAITGDPLFSHQVVFNVLSTSTESMTALTASPNPSVLGQPVTFTATVTNGSSGTVNFLDGTMVIGGAPLVAGRATLTTSSLSVGSHNITAAYSGGGGSPPSTSPVLVQVVGRIPSVTAISVSPTNPSLGSPVTVTATVTPGVATPLQPTGTITFIIDARVAAVVPLSGNHATFTTSRLGPGPHLVSAAYSGDANFLASSSFAAAATVTCTTNITGFHRGNIVAGPGSTCLVNAQLLGAIVVPVGAALDLQNSMVIGSVTATSPSLVTMCNDAIGGTVFVTAATGPVVIGDSANGCAPNTIGGSLIMTNNTHGFVAIGNHVSDQTVSTGNSGPPGPAQS